MASSIAEYFDGNVKSLANVRHGAKFSVGIIQPGEYRFGTPNNRKRAGFYYPIPTRPSPNT